MTCALNCALHGPTILRLEQVVLLKGAVQCHYGTMAALNALPRSYDCDKQSTAHYQHSRRFIWAVDSWDNAEKDEYCKTCQLLQDVKELTWLFTKQMKL